MIPPADLATLAPRELWSLYLLHFDLHLATIGAADSSRRKHAGILAQLRDAHSDRSPWSLTHEDLVTWLAAEAIAPATWRSRAASARAFYVWAVRAGHLETSPAHRLPSVSVPQPLPRPIPDQALADALDGADDRVRLILRLAAELGLRRAEIAQAHTRDLHEVGDRTVMLVHGKGARERTVPVPQRLARWLATLPEGYLLPSTSQIGHLTPRTVGKLAAAALPTPHTLHTLRHRYATSAYRVSRDLYAVQRLLGHASPTITQRYVGLDVAGLHGLADAIAEAPLPAPSRLTATG
ncbi:tyrosine-type recombinase/integrase [Brachybacterium sp. AOP42-E1-35]|uniref:tyrosine-type recombinase/integrase n=1 Tax=unclassified Brachybacterium TaxID=2623841 RepID=UPI00402AB81E